ncbi:Iron-sulfur cluster assembly protein SufB [Candidatus Syntrophocurvum alkaliphilum]|uniref:Iron-sulfur cluster assembly protein SufB n=1 Tax=Candidatus Syntrophocurvum alkaliphilum TaxID=2293317 RepID=A0A6I6D962_9FIRM|nr:SufD family Fe-S cluster assembly protein [Candidatus Syntrophocurvum alkaliphilum]QGT99027.1 Iron-sulfur cluster assembly protein SufB [Candidatus Syntrophocurvum alkaliphilum]
MKLNNIETNLLDAIANIKDIPEGALNIRKDGQALARSSSSNISITSMSDKPGMVVEVKSDTVNESVHVPVILTQPGFQDKVYNTFIIGERADVNIIAGCGIHNPSHMSSRHDGIHEIIVKKDAKMRYVEKHYGEGNEKGKNVLNPTTVITLEEGAFAELEMVQIQGVDDTVRSTKAYVKANASLKIVERLLTDGTQSAESTINIYIDGKNGSAQIISRSVAQDDSYQGFHASLIGKTECLGHVECDAIIMDNAKIKAVPELWAENSNAVLTHEAAIGKIAGEQLIKLMSLGLTEQEAIDTIINSFLK